MRQRTEIKGTSSPAMIWNNSYPDINVQNILIKRSIQLQSSTRSLPPVHSEQFSPIGDLHDWAAGWREGLRNHMVYVCSSVRRHFGGKFGITDKVAGGAVIRSGTELGGSPGDFKLSVLRMRRGSESVYLSTTPLSVTFLMWLLHCRASARTHSYPMFTLMSCTLQLRLPLVSPFPTLRAPHLLHHSSASLHPFTRFPSLGGLHGLVVAELGSGSQRVDTQISPTCANGRLAQNPRRPVDSHPR
ncbi:hypothetical protein CRENBAI_008951 [Crenichthys baileyi]|uniref:Uncharacterized protein n=1 Tax=Crenichthys baileyi TaxID=28760 RepID=A0AAV9R921_9TELE